MRCRSLLAVFAVTVAASVAAPAAAQSSANEWQFAIAPYLWAAGMDGTMAIADFEEDIDVPFSTIVDNLDLAFMAHFDMRNDHWVVSSDLIFVDLENSDDAVNGTVTAGLEMTVLEAWAGYRVSPAVTLLGGARWVDMSASLRYTGQVVNEGPDAGNSWIDPLVGMHVLAPLSDRWWLGVHGDIGGFGVGSELTWQAYADIGWKASDLVVLVLGYRALDIDYEDGSGARYVGLDMAMTGPQLGVVFTF